MIQAYAKAAAVSIPVWLISGAIANEIGHALNLYRPWEVAMTWANIAACLTTLYLGNKWQLSDAIGEKKLMYHRRFYDLDLETTFHSMQLAMSKAFIGSNRWNMLTSDLSTGYLLYGLRWNDVLLNGQSQIEPSGRLAVQLKDATVNGQFMTEAIFAFETNVGWPTEKEYFNQAIKAVMAQIDIQIPNGRNAEFTDEELSKVA